MRSSTWGGLLLALLAVAAMALYAWRSLAAAPPALEQQIDMQADANGDQLPDALVAELERLGALFARDLDASEDKAALAVIGALANRLPLADSTRDTQQQAKALLEKQAATDDPAAKAALAQQVDQLLAQAETFDPTYRLARATVEKLAGNRLQIAQPDATPDDASGPDFSGLKRGHIMLVRGGDIYLNWIYAQHYSHAGMYDGNGLVYESNPDGVRLKPLADWQEPGHLVGLGYNNKLSDQQVQAALDWAKQTYSTDGSTHYNHDIPDKWTEDKLYCSQLVWRINQHAGVDLDSNDFWYLAWISTRLGPAGLELALPAVLPDELAYSDHVTIYSAGVTK